MRKRHFLPLFAVSIIATFRLILLKRHSSELFRGGKKAGKWVASARSRGRSANLHSQMNNSISGAGLNQSALGRRKWDELFSGMRGELSWETRCYYFIFLLLRWLSLEMENSVFSAFIVFFASNIPPKCSKISTVKKIQLILWKKKIIPSFWNCDTLYRHFSQSLPTIFTSRAMSR